MSSVDIYGIKNCDTMKKAFKWLDENNLAYSFHDYKKEGVDREILECAIAEHGWEAVINRRGTTWRKLDETVKNSMNADKAILIATENPSIVKRPLTVKNLKTYLGFEAKLYNSVFK